ncbi:hypothetical protein M8J75_007234 [Diaphorina citri]|nr:hypothetical protein M8J75_007234 [Diaphorina citri]
MSDRYGEYYPSRGTNFRNFNRGRPKSNRGGARPARNPRNYFNVTEEPGPSVSKPATKITKPDVPSSAFKPKAVSTNYTPEKNDPCLEEAAFLSDGRKGFSVTPAPRRFENDYSQYITLVETSYQAMTAVDKGFHKRISFSMYQYYCVIALWKRLIDASRTTDEAAYLKFNKIFGSLTALDQLPSELVAYLSCIGDLTDDTGRPVSLRVQMYPIQAQLMGASGHYGRVGPNTYHWYSSIPSPFIALYRVIQDFNFQEDEDPNWDLPPLLRPQTQLATLPNANLLGKFTMELTAVSCSRARENSVDEGSLRKNEKRDPDSDFFKSILPQIKGLTDRKKLKFRIKILELLDEMMNDDDE